MVSGQAVVAVVLLGLPGPQTQAVVAVVVVIV
jgi:hypothetical protein